MEVMKELNMRTNVLLGLLTLGALTIICSAQMNPNLIVANKRSQHVEIVALDSSARPYVSAEIEKIFDRLPPGSFLLNNKTSEPITAIVTTWDYVDNEGLPRQIRLNCDAYLAAPLEPLVYANETSLITPYSCASQRIFERLERGAVIGSPLEPNIGRSFSPDLRSPIHIYVDSLVYRNGDVWGPDNLKYYEVIQERHAEVNNFVTELTTTRARGTDLPTALSRIEDDASVKHDKAQTRRKYLVKLLRASPNPEGTLEQLRNHPKPPNFRHIGEP